ncbi:hypothetical protein GP486_002122 [Trichoglossum hirsutum]|uniref:BAH domain-containing protein n=1 Tax=Trichoglossum hirsutum TaxID=265104 RepID=A0A9P8LFC8_9PEZI|nr:hypothetical protein GP486_002122 [Trichoglossum hirsutum]
MTDGLDALPPHSDQNEAVVPFEAHNRKPTLPRIQPVFDKSFIDNISIEPHGKWKELKVHSYFKIGHRRFDVGQDIFVNNSDIPQGSNLSEKDLYKLWPAKIIEIRVDGLKGVFILVGWYYWPEGLPGGRQNHHLINELIASNHVDIIAATTVATHAQIRSWQGRNGPEKLKGFFCVDYYDVVEKRVYSLVMSGA